MVYRLRERATGRLVTVLFLLVAVLGLSFNYYLTPAYQAVSGGAVPFDLQFPLGAEAIGIQLALLTPDSIAAYRRFFAVDLIFPVAGAVFTTVLWAWLLNRIRLGRLDRFYALGLWLLPFVPAGFDLAENFLFLRIVANAPDALPGAIDTAVMVHRYKMSFMNTTTLITAVLAATAAFTWLLRRFVRADQRT